jgi:secreted trypsin-like serine protease
MCASFSPPNSFALALVAILSLMFVSEAYGDDFQGRINGGKPTKRGEYGEFVLLATRRPYGGYLANDFFCGGTLIRRNVVLTAAHCKFPAMATSNYQVFKGGIRLDEENRTVVAWDAVSKVEKFVVIPSYDDETTTDDIALIFLKDNLPKPYAKLPSRKRSDPKVGAKVTVIGFGDNNYWVNTETDPPGGDAPPRLYKVNLRVGNPKKGYCLQMKKFLDFQPKTEFCLIGSKFDLNEEALDINDNKNPGYRSDCFGDSGGPSFDEYGVQVGLVSYGPNSDRISCDLHFNDPTTIHTNVRKYLKWIRTTIRKERMRL